MVTSTDLLPSVPAYLLVFHGSRDPRPQIAATTLKQLFADRMPHAIVETAYLECGPLSLHQQIQQFSATLRSQPSSSARLIPSQLRILPLFLLAGVHVMEDIPAEVALVQSSIAAEIEICSHLGSHPQLSQLLTQQMAAQAVDAWIVLAHGSRRPQANQPIDELAAQLGAVSAFWSVAPKLESQVQMLLEQGSHKIGILPYFLFPGGITDAIAATVSQLAAQSPKLELHLTQPLNASPELADLLVDLAQQPSHSFARPAL